SPTTCARSTRRTRRSVRAFFSSATESGTFILARSSGTPTRISATPSFVRSVRPSTKRAASRSSKSEARQPPRSSGLRSHATGFGLVGVPVERPAVALPQERDLPVDALEALEPEALLATAEACLVRKLGEFALPDITNPMRHQRSDRPREVLAGREQLAIGHHLDLELWVAVLLVPLDVFDRWILRAGVVPERELLHELLRVLQQVQRRLADLSDRHDVEVRNPLLVLGDGALDRFRIRELVPIRGEVAREADLVRIAHRLQRGKESDQRRHFFRILTQPRAVDTERHDVQIVEQLRAPLRPLHEIEAVGDDADVPELQPLLRITGKLE